MAAELKTWKCKCGHVMGHVKWVGHGESQLYLYREAINLANEAPDEQEVMAVLEGYSMAIVICSVCANERKWAPGSKPAARFMTQRKDR